MKKDKKNGSIDWMITIVPLLIILVLSLLFMCFPKKSSEVVAFLRNIFVNELGFFYILIGLGMILVALGLAFSIYGQIKLGNLEKPKYGTFNW